LSGPQLRFSTSRSAAAGRVWETMAMQGNNGMLRVCLFGAPFIGAAGDRIALSPQQFALVALVYGHGEAGVSRLSAASFLWGTDSAKNARQRIRQLLLEVRTRVGQSIIDTPADFLRPVPGVSSDLRMVEGALKEGSLHRAAELATMGFLRSMEPPTEQYEDWRDGKDVALRRSLRAAALARGSTAQSCGDWEAARDAAEALLALEPDSPMAVERTVRSRGRTGDFDGAERALAEYLARLPAGAEPDRTVVEAIDTARSIQRIQSLNPPDTAEVPFIGRRTALNRARTTLDAIRDGRFEMLLISGESGIGKTRVLGEVCREAAARGFRCLMADPVELERSIPLNCLLDALRNVDLDPHLGALGRPWSSVIASLLPPGALRHPPEDPPPIQPSSLSRRLLDSVHLLFDRLAREQPTILFIDDLQWADATTIAALQFMQRRWTDGAFGVFATVRPDLVRVTDPVAKYLTTAEDIHADVIELTALTTEEAHSLINAVADKELQANVVQRLCAIAGHHPLYLAELTRDFLAGRIQLPERAGDQLRIPASLTRMLDARLEAMSERARRVAGVLAVAARALRIDVLADIAELAIQEGVDAVDVLLRARFVELDRSEVRFTHELFRSAVYRHLSEPRRALHHRAIAKHLLADAQEELAGEVAVHYSRAGDVELAARFGWAAAKRASEAGALAEAIQFYEVVVESETDAVRQAEASAELAGVLYLSRDITRANPQLSLAAARLRALGRLDEARRLEIKRVEGLAEVGDVAVPVLVDLVTAIKLEAEAERDWETVALALDAELHLLHRVGDIDGIRVVLQQMRSVAAVGSTDAQLVCKAGLALGVFFDDPTEALAAACEALELAAAARTYRLRALARYMIVLHARGELSDATAADIVTEARALAEASGDVMERFAIESNVAVALLDAGEIESAEAMMVRAARVVEKGDMDLHRFIRANNQAELALAVGDLDAAKLAFTEAGTFLGPTSPSYMRDLVNAGLGYCALESGDVGEARRREAALGASPTSWYYDPTTLLTFQARLLERRGKWQEAVAIVRAAATDLEARIVLAWYKLRLLEVRMLVKYGHPDAKRLAEEGERKALEAGLKRRAKDFAALVFDFA